jgi:hypothetical protein
MAAQENTSAATPSTGIQFVNLGANVTEEERKRHQRLIRSAAMKKFRDEQKKSKSKAQGPNVQEAKSVVGSQHIFQVEKAKTGPSRNPQSYGAHITSAYGQEDVQLASISHIENSTHLTTIHSLGEPEAETGEIVPESSKKDEESKADESYVTSKELINFLGAGSSDPFYAFPGGTSPDAGYLIDHCRLYH